MARVYTGKSTDRRYKGEKADITYNARRCIHAEECVHRLSTVFDRTRVPWIEPDAATPDSLVELVRNCPSGALHIERRDGGTDEPIPLENHIILWKDGPLHFIGDLEIHSTNAKVAHETRATLCRCGESKSKPFCDNTHIKTGFAPVEIAPPEDLNASEIRGGKLKITAYPNGEYEIEGPFKIVNAAGEILYAGEKEWLCRCGHSGRKPFCDSTHKTIGFTAD